MGGMAGSCCDPRGCDAMFTTRFAEHRAKRYRTRGLDRTEADMVTFLESVGIEGKSVLEIGGGVGEIQLALLTRGAASGTTVELVDSYDGPAAALAAEEGVSDRAHRAIGDIAVDPSVAPPADLVVLHRVVCCYPDLEALLAAAADHTRRALVLSHPPHHLLARGATGAINLTQRLARREYRSFSHDPAQMRAVLTEHGLRPVHRRSGPLWQVIGAVRTDELKS